MNIDENDELSAEDFELLPDLPEELEVSADPVVEETDELEEPQEIEEEITEEPEAEPEVVEDEDDIFAAQSFYDMLKERQLVPEKEITSWEDLEEEIEVYKTALPNQVKENIVNSASPVAQSFLAFAMDKPDLTEKDLLEYLDAYKEDKVTEEIVTKDQARHLLKPELVAQWGENTAEAMLDSLEDDGVLIEKAKTSRVSKQDALNAQAAEENNSRQTQQSNFVNSLYQEFDDQPWQDDHKIHIKEFYTSGKIDQTIQEISTDPKSLVQLVNILNYYDSKSKSFNLDTFFNKAATRNTNSIRDSIKEGLQNRGTSTKQKTARTGFDPTQFELA
jgi:hypothetical protein